MYSRFILAPWLLFLIVLPASDARYWDGQTSLAKTFKDESPCCHAVVETLRGGGWLIPAGYHPLGYRITKLGETFLSFAGSLDADVGRFLASLKKRRVTKATMKDSWLEIVRASKTAQSMRIYRHLDDFIDFCLKSGLID